MWKFEHKKLATRDGLQFSIHRGASSVTVAEIVEAWQHDAEFRAQFNAALADVPYSAFRWETPAVTAATPDHAFEFVVLNDPGLERRPDINAFDKYFRDGAEVVTFANLGGDAVLVVPCPKSEPSGYVHLASFVRRAPESQRHALWQAVGQAMAKRISRKPVWLSTAGAGVAWLHVRLDDRPKYYGHPPYRTA